MLDESDWIPSVILFGADAINETTWQVVQDARKTTCYNLHGITECTVDLTCCRIDATAGRPTIGRPMSNSRIYILDQNLRAVPLGRPGELYIGGSGLARGYLN